MSGTFRNLRITTLLAVSLAVVMVHEAEGYPYQWQDFFSYSEEKEPPTRDGVSSSSGPRVSPSISKIYGSETEVSGEVFPREYLWSKDDDENGNPRVNGGSMEKRTQHSEDDADETDDDGDEEAERDDEDDEYAKSRRDQSKDWIAQLIEQAVKDNVFLTREKWAKRHADKPFDIPDDEGTSVKIQKTRSPADPSSKTTQTGHYSTGDKIVFPDDLHNRRSNNFASSAVPSCADTTFCLNPPYYPSAAEIEDALKKRYLEPVTEPPSISERIGPIEDENGLCISLEQVIQPKTGLDDSKEWRYILNNENYVQTVRVELCQTKDGACQIIDDIASGYKTSCKQKYIYRHLVAIGKNGTASIPFQIPSSCCCHVKFDGNPMLRIGLSLSKRKQQTPVPNGTGN